MAIHVIEAVTRSSARSAGRVHLKMKRGLDSLAAIAATAQFVGLFGTVLGIANSFPGLGTSAAAGRAVVTGLLSQSLIPTALGLLVAILAFWFYSYLSNKLATFDIEMHNASLELVNRLTLLR